MWLGTRGSKENTGRSSPNISVGAIFNDTARVFPAEKQSPIGESLMQVILSPQEAADFLYFLMNVISMESARMITPSTAPISFYRRGLDERYGPGTAHALEERYRDSQRKNHEGVAAQRIRSQNHRTPREASGTNA
jgi:hypothetical protein